MAAIDVHMFLENLKQLMSSGLDFFASQRDELQIVYQYINKLSMLLKSAEEEGSTDQKENSVAMRIRDLVFEAENIVDQFIVDSVSSGGGCDFDLSTKLAGVKGKMEAIINICKHGKFELEWWYSKPADSSTHAVGLRPQKDKMMCRFKHGISLEIISTVSLPGTGKTTLAKQISNDHCTKEKFEIQVWVKVCEGYRKRDFLAAILDSLNPIFKEKWDTAEEELGAQLLECLQDHKYLIVMNDVSTAHELFDLQTYLPNQCNGSKIIVTTWEAFVGRGIKERDYYEPDVCMFLEKLKQLMSSGIDFVTSQRDELQIVYEYINEMGMLLKLAEEEVSTDMAMHIRDVVFGAENTVDLFVVNSFSLGGGSDCDLSTKLDSVKGEMEAIINYCKHVKFELEWVWYTKAADNTNHIAGLRLHRDRLMCRVKHGKSLEIISIVGLPGTGTTTLANRIYNDYCTKETFEIQVWVKVCPGYRKRDFLAAILESLSPIFKGQWVAGEEALGAQLLECLQDRKYLIVMNDMSTPQELFDLQTYLPSQCNGSKIIVTSWQAFIVREIKEQDYYETAVRMFLEILNQLMSSGLDFVASQRDELQIVYEYINEMSMLLKSTEEEGSMEKAMHIRDLVFEAQSIVVEYSVSSGGCVDCDVSTKLDIVKGEMEAIIKRTKDSKFELEWWYMKAADSSCHVVGMRPQMDKIMRTFKDGKSLEILSIAGLPGTGKTTLAKQIYNDRKEFEIQMWIKVSQGGYRKRDFLAAILESFNLHTFKDEMDTSEEALGGLLLEHLQDHKYLIVMDDMRSARALFDLQTYLPDQCNGSKIIVTTGESMVTKAIREQNYYNSYTTSLDLLSEEDGWGLFRRILWGDITTVISKDLEEFGKLIVKQCHGLPLAIAAISGVVARKSETPSFWGSAAHTLGIFQVLYTRNLMCRYNQLPPHLKACFQYIGLFPQDYHIPVQNLVWLLIAEGFVTEEAPTPEVVAEGYIKDLIDTCLVVALGKRMCGATKTCCISSLMREFCSTQNAPRRWFISCQAVTTRVSLDAASMQSLRSLLCFGKRKHDRFQIDVARIFCGDGFKLLKALDLLPVVGVQESVFAVTNLKLLTFLACPWVIRPEPMTSLFNLETLILSVRQVAYLPPSILKMDKLRHVRNERGVICFESSGILANADFGANVQTMDPLCGCTICRLVLAKFQRIRKLCLSSRLISRGFDSGPGNLSLLEDLETLKCSYSENCAYTNRVWEANFQFQLPSSIKRLTLRYTYLEWEMISTLGTLPNLEVLKLLNNACAKKVEESSSSSSCWDTSGQKFPRLKCLKMQYLDITKWADNDVQFKSLEVLSIVRCHQLRMLPSGLAHCPRLCTLEVKWCNDYVEAFCNSIV